MRRKGDGLRTGAFLAAALLRFVFSANHIPPPQPALCAWKFCPSSVDDWRPFLDNLGLDCGGETARTTAISYEKQAGRNRGALGTRSFLLPLSLFAQASERHGATLSVRQSPWRLATTLWWITNGSPRRFITQARRAPCSHRLHSCDQLAEAAS